ncbi:MAG: N-acetyltransferase [Pirellulaceae bacterium]|nr:N-acetyltransferase [Pirellulaceae bacterium]
MIEIRDERPDDRPAIRDLITAAFTRSQHGYHDEADLVDAIRLRCPDVVSMVATADQSSEKMRLIVGHLLLSPVVIESTDSDDTLVGKGLGPVAVAPDHQRAGIAASMIQMAIDRLSKTGCPFVVVLGDPNYYSRFGFVAAIETGISHGFAGIAQEFFLIRWLSDSASKRLPGFARYRDEFGEQFHLA